MIAPRIPVAYEGYPFIGFSAFSTVVFASLGMVAATFVCLAITAFTLYFFRDPERVLPADENSIVSPADGRIILAEKVEDQQFTQGPAWKVSIFMNVFNVHVNRAPLAGTVERILYKPGKFHSADSKKGALENEYCATCITTEHGKRVAFVQIAGLIARRIVCWLEPGDTAVKGKRFGLIRFGSRVDLYLPVDAVLKIQPGDRVRAGESIIGFLG